MQRRARGPALPAEGVQRGRGDRALHHHLVAARGEGEGRLGGGRQRGQVLPPRLRPVRGDVALPDRPPEVLRAQVDAGEERVRDQGGHRAAPGAGGRVGEDDHAARPPSASELRPTYGRTVHSC